MDRPDRSAALPEPDRSWLLPVALALLVLLLCLGLNWQLWRQARAAEAQQVRAEFDLRAREVTNQLALRVHSYVQGLRSVQALFSSSDSVTRTEFSTFVKAQDIAQHMPGMQALGYIALIEHGQMARHVARTRAEGFHDYAVRPPGERDVYAPVVYIEPPSRVNLRAFGYDTWSELARRRALELARDGNQAAMSGQLTLVQDSGKTAGGGFLILLPVYQNGAPLETREQRMRAIRGWVYAPVRARDMVAALDPELAAGLDIEMYDGDAASDAARMYSALAPGVHPDLLLRTEKKIGIGFHRWTLAIGALPGFGQRNVAGESRVMLAVGVAGSAILALLTGMLAWKSRRAERGRAKVALLDNELERSRKQLEGLSESAERAQLVLRSILDSAIDGILVDDGARRILLSNQRFRELWSVPPEMALDGDDRAVAAHLVAQLVHAGPFLHSREMQYSGTSAERDLLRLKDGRFFEQFVRQVVLGSGQNARLWSFRDITERKQIEQRERSHRHVLELLARGAPLREILEAVVLGVEATNPGMLCSIMLLTPDGRHLINGAAPSLPAYFNEAFDGAEIGPRAGSCGAAAFSGARVIVEDISLHDDWVLFREVAQRAGLASCWSQPIRGGSGRIIGSFAIYHRTVHYPSPAHVVLIEQAAQLTSIAIEQAQAAQALRAGEDRFRSLVDHAPVPLWQQDWSQVEVALEQLCDLGMDDLGSWLRARPHEIARLAAMVRISDANAAALAHVGAHGKDLAALSLAQHFDVQGEPCFVDALLALSGGAQVFSCDSSFRRLDGSARQHALTLLVMPGHAEELDFVIVTTVDITERKRIDAELLQLASTDFLTGLPNRREFMGRMEDQLARMQRDVGECASVLMLDIDHFKQVNDRHGHAVGDEVLCHLAEVLRSSQRKIDTPGRMGGEEFALLLPGADIDAAAAFAERLRQSVAGSPYPGEAGPLAVTVSIGIASMYPQDGSADAALKRADRALYRAKEAGRNRVGKESDVAPA
ncbi:CHASE domain-containing protein [Massilia sp. CF038]|uniref:sensor domain-containing diguanylate cyclase n=1 Tax=Massilia sp. CF038 TaxID=1881045 RepID=UPI000923F08D|nr:CHASE domain-containing protein [Massilia sp. CF038]SHH64010.1 diguanylate cyclase (GGDEF) domain-containing protein [Massilia sp. CF038]